MTDYNRLPGPALDRWECQQRGACVTTDTELFFHPDNERGPRREAREAAAKAVCAGCPVLAQCRDYALATREPFGVWGGLSEPEREAILAREMLRAS